MKDELDMKSCVSDNQHAKIFKTADFQAACETKVIKGKGPCNWDCALLISCKRSLNTTVVENSHLFDVKTVQLLIERLLLLGSRIFKLVPRDVDLV